MRQSVITCDDCGLSEGINRATVELYDKGIATAASIIVNFPATEHAFKLFSAYPGLELGLHLNLTDGFPLTKLASPSHLTRTDGRLSPRQVLFAHALFPLANFLELAEAEMRAQIEAFTRFGQTPAHLTTHLHFHAVPSLRQIVVRLAREFDIPWVRTYSLSAGVLPQNPFYTTRAAPRAALTTDTFKHDHLIGLKWWVSHEPERLLSVLTTLEGAKEIVVHPCTSQDSTYPDGVRYSPHQRHTEMRYLENIHRRLQQL